MSVKERKLLRIYYQSNNKDIEATGERNAAYSLAKLFSDCDPEEEEEESIWYPLLTVASINGTPIHAQLIGNKYKINYVILGIAVLLLLIPVGWYLVSLIKGYMH